MALPAHIHGDHQPFVPLYEQLVEQYRDAILSHVLHPGDRVDSITEIQRRHRVSRETAKRVLRIYQFRLDDAVIGLDMGYHLD